MSELKERLRGDLTSAMKAKDEIATATLRMALAAVSTEEVSGKAARELSDDEVVKVLNRELKKRKEAAEAFAGAGRTESADRERAEAEVLSGYLPAQLSDDELGSLVGEVITAVAEELGSAPGQKQMGQVMKAANAKVAGRAEGGRVASVVRAKLQQG